MTITALFRASSRPRLIVVFCLGDRHLRKAREKCYGTYNQLVSTGEIGIFGFPFDSLKQETRGGVQGCGRVGNPVLLSGLFLSNG